MSGKIPNPRRLSGRLLNRLESRLGRERLHSKPVAVDVVLTKACNLACSFCRDYELVGAKRMTVEGMELLAAELFPNAAWVNICSGGEPYLHKGLEHLLLLAQGHGAQRWVLSNGMLLEGQRMQSIVERDLITLHGFSVDGIRADTVESIRTGAELPRILANIERYLRLGEQIHGRRSRVVIRYALMRRNVDQLAQAVRYWGERGVERIDAGYLALANGIDRNESLFFHQDHMRRAFDGARAVAEDYPETELRLPPTVEEDRARRDSPKACRAPWEFVMIDASGAVLPCYRAFEAIQMGHVLGSEARPFNEIWNGPLYRELRRNVNVDRDTGDPAAPNRKGYGYCRVCENRFGWSSIEPHLGDDTWQRTAMGEGGQAIDHRRQGFRDWSPEARPAGGPIDGQRDGEQRA
ncbi:radical SAM protein [Engelhardtia mirabilis]|uniref:Pyrroloquinoline quinone biosynthesis protein PqqE n=1 Tax=Engelhardtia mirabilis TaxID=2528011 RepID=A0A518BID4_9BACT|nr:pyrroloquinoline quinone biosynthesis protein PqqE [Planctomycetes bacterium Pla133]QDV01058.1 pyrroloquinoline quinone biosynthesis protein PqqE [Planctomycetes bacterium Pla86]